MNPGVTKGWKLHRRSTSNIAVITGALRFWVRDERDGSATKGLTEQYDLAPVEGRYQLLTIPPSVVYAWKNLGETPAMACNSATEPWTAEENTNLPLETYPLA